MEEEVGEVGNRAGLRMDECERVSGGDVRAGCGEDGRAAEGGDDGGGGGGGDGDGDGDRAGNDDGEVRRGGGESLSMSSVSIVRSGRMSASSLSLDASSRRPASSNARPRENLAVTAMTCSMAAAKEKGEYTVLERVCVRVD